MTEFAGVRMAEPADEEQLYGLLQKAHAENGMLPMDEELVRAGIRRATGRDGGIIGVIDSRNGLEASVGIFIERLWYSYDYWLVDHWCFVRADARKSTHAQRLIDFAKWSADQLGLPLIMGVVSNEHTEAKVRLYRRKLPFAGGFFLYKPEHAVERAAKTEFMPNELGV